MGIGTCLMPIDSGQILFDEKSLRETKIGYVFQNYRDAMFPWLRTVDDIGYEARHRQALATSVHT